ncbi:hypothetical protein HJFPF1_13080 [Paramyrothecium foliicola]|nr:hypothetical protein HJFPF1_13080 [Paramyrothecium foliicola]
MPEYGWPPSSPITRSIIIGILPILALVLLNRINTSHHLRYNLSIMDVEFNPERCAVLHNKLLAKTYESIPNASQHFERNMISRVREAIPDAVEGLLEVPEEVAESFTAEDLPFYRFFSKIDSYKPEVRPLLELPLTGELKQPDPTWFYHSLLEDSDDERHIILLYPDNVLPEPQDGGLFLDLGTWMVTWARPTTPKDIPEDIEAWVPLELALRKGLEMWDRGKYYWDGEPLDRSSRLLIRSWTQRDLGEAIKTWETLLQAIQGRLPTETATATTWEDPLPADLVDEFQISPFAKAFLKAARRPPFTYVAPGLTAFTDSYFGELMRSETANAPRRAEIARIDLEPDAWPSLILPVAAHLGSITRDPRPPGDQFFDKPWGYGRYTIARTAGLYTGILREDGDTTLLITVEGKADDQPIRFAFPRPWGNYRTLTFAEMFDLWAHYVTQGLWKIDEHGVATSHNWFTQDDTVDERRLYWSQDSR